MSPPGNNSSISEVAISPTIPAGTPFSLTAVLIVKRGRGTALYTYNNVSHYSLDELDIYMISLVGNEISVFCSTNTSTTFSGINHINLITYQTAAAV